MLEPRLEFLALPAIDNKSSADSKIDKGTLGCFTKKITSVTCLYASEQHNIHRYAYKMRLLRSFGQKTKSGAILVYFSEKPPKERA